VIPSIRELKILERDGRSITIDMFSGAVMRGRRSTALYADEFVARVSVGSYVRGLIHVVWWTSDAYVPFSRTSKPTQPSRSAVVVADSMFAGIDLMCTR
jgi:hypothetical protein